MQTLIQVICTRGPSLRDAISRDPRIEKFGLVVSETRRMDRPEGWTKIHASSDDVYGAVNVQWVPSSTTLLCRIVTRGGDPGPITGRFIGYLVSRFRRRIEAIHVIPGH
jgi:hypothetical protein